MIVYNCYLFRTWAWTCCKTVACAYGWTLGVLIDLYFHMILITGKIGFGEFIILTTKHLARDSGREWLYLSIGLLSGWLARTIYTTEYIK